MGYTEIIQSNSSYATMNQDVTLALFDRLAALEQAALTDSFAKRHKVIAETNDIMLATASECRRRNWKIHTAIWNPCLFLNTVAFDLSYLAYELAYEEDQWKRGLTARHLATLLFEIAEDLPQVFGKDFNKALDALAVGSDLRDSFRSQLKSVSKFWANHREELKQIRTVCGAHRDHDAILLLQTIDQIDLFKILQLGISLDATLNKVGPAAQAIIAYTSTVQPPELTK